MKASQQIRLKSQTGSAAKQKIKLSQINPINNPQNAYSSAMKGGSITKSNNGTSISNDRHVSFDRTLYHSTAATIAQRAGSGLAGIRPRSPLNAQVSNAYQSISDENQFDNVPVKLNSLNEEYKKRQMKMDDRLKQEIENHSIAVVTKNPDKQGGTVIRSLNIKKAVSPLHDNASYINTQGVVNSGEDQSQKFFRSQRSVAMRIKDTYENQVQILETDKLQLIQKLNDSLLQLDKLNQEKATLSNELIELLKFVRDMQRETQKGDDLGSVVNDDLKAELRSEKELSHQLKEDLKAAEAERVRILQRIQELSHLTQDGEIRQNDMNVNYTVKTRTYGDIQEELKDIIERIRTNENDVDRLNAIIYANKDTIRQLRDKIDLTIDEKRNLHNKIALLQDRHDEAIINYEKERHDTDHLQSRHIRLISTNILFETLEELYRRNLQIDFNQLRFVTESANKIKLGFRKLRKLVKSNRTKRLKRFLYNWYSLALKPMKSKKQQYRLSLFLKQQRPLLSAFSQWINAYHISQSKTHKKKQVILQMLQSKNDYHQRLSKHFFIRWRDIIKMNTNQKNKVLLKNIIKKHRSESSRYFAKWLEVSQDLQNQIQLGGMAQRLAFKKYLGQLFNNWRLAITDIKTKRISVLNRVWKNMRIFTMTRKQMRGQTWSILREERKRTENLVKSCFDAMRQYKEQEKLLKMTTVLNEFEVPQKLQANKAIQEVSKINRLRQREQGLKTIQRCLGKQLNQYFEKWRQYSEYHRDLINKNLKQMIIKVYLQHLRNAFTSWIKYKGEAMIQFQSEEIGQEEQVMADNTALIKQAQNEIEEKENKQKNLGSKQIRKIMNNLVNKRQRELFMQWKMNIDKANFTLDKTDNILKKLNRRQKRQCFDRYLTKVKEIKQEQIDEGKVQEYHNKHSELLRKKIFKGILQFSREYLSAKNYLRRVILKLDISVKESAYKKWIKYRQYKDEKNLKQNQAQKVETINELNVAIEDKSILMNAQINKIEYLGRRVNGNTFRRVKMGFQRFCQSNSEYGFKKWVKYCELIKKQKQVLTKCFNHQSQYTHERAFKIWKEYLSHQVQQVFIENITYEEKRIAKIESEILQHSKMHGMSSDQCAAEIEKLQAQQQEYMKKHQNCLQTLISRVDNKDFVTKQRYILLQWHNFVQQRKRCIKILENGIQKTLWQHGFQAIKEKAQIVHENRQKQKMTNLLVLKYNKIKTRFAFCQWRAANQIIIQSSQQDIDKQLKLMNKNHSQLKAVIKDRVQEQLVENLKNCKAFDVFIAWRNISRSNKLLNAKIQTYETEIHKSQITNALSKWSSRTRKTQQFRHIKTKIDRIYKNQLVKNVFSSIHEQKNISKDFCNSLGSLATVLDKIYTKQTFNKIKLESQCYQYRTQQSKLKGIHLLGDKLSQLLKKRQLQVMNDLKIASVLNEKFSQEQKATIKYYLLKKIRDYFYEWKRESDRKEIVRFMNEEGPISIQNHNLKKVIFNLKKFAIDDGIERPQVEQVILHNRRQSIKGIEKSVCRLFCYNDQLYLLPKFLDKWKQWVKLRKQYKKSMDFLNKFVDRRLSLLQYSFKRWKYGDLERFNQLSQMTKPQLALITYRNSNNIDNLTDNLVGADDNLHLLTGQRDFLLQRYVGSQRLALAATKAQMDRTRQKALSRWIENSAQEVSYQYEDALKGNLQKIQALKDRIKNLERSNTDLADQNEDLRIGALDGIEMAKSIDDLTRDREKLSVDLADKVMTIRKLIEDNNNLSIRLSNAQEEAQNLIRVSQIKLGKINDPMYDDDY